MYVFETVMTFDLTCPQGLVVSKFHTKTVEEFVEVEGAYTKAYVFYFVTNMLYELKIEPRQQRVFVG